MTSVNRLTRLTSSYRVTSDQIKNAIHRDLADKFNQENTPPEVASLFYKSLLQEAALASFEALGQQQAKRLLREIIRDVL